MSDRPLVAEGRALLEQVNRVVDAVRSPAADVSGRVLVGAFATAARGIVAPALRTLREHPGLELHLVEAEPELSVPMVLRGELDVAISNDWTDDAADDPRLVRTHLLDDPVVVALPLDHRLARRRRVRLEDLAADRWIAWPQGTLCRRWLLGELRPLGSPTVAHTAGEHATQLTLVAAGEGIAVLPRMGLPPESGQVALVALRDPLSRRVEALTRRHAADHPAVRATLDALRGAAATTVRRG